METPTQTCDLVMKGGVTSGIVYPRLVTRLARRYRFVRIGGSSAGAIAAAFTAAAEYERRERAAGRAPRSDGPTGFALLDGVPEELAGGLGALFAPRRGLGHHLAALLAFVDGQGAGRYLAVARHVALGTLISSNSNPQLLSVFEVHLEYISEAGSSLLKKATNLGFFKNEL